MRIEEIRQLNLDEKNKTLRNPKSVKSLTKDEIWKCRDVFSIIVNDVIRNENRESFFKSMKGKNKMRFAGIKKFKVVDKNIGIYSIVTDFGEGRFFDAHKLYGESGEYPKWVKPNNCFLNSHFYVMQNPTATKILSGIAYMKKPFLHSVVSAGDNILDFNYDLVISKDLYLALMNFEVLAEVDCGEIARDKKLILASKGVQAHEINFAYDDIISELKGLNEGIGV